MRLKQKVALLLAGVMTIGSVGFMNPTEVKAAGESNTFTITVPANVSITDAGWNSIGTVNVAGNIATDKKITVSIATTNEFKLKSGNNEVGYTIKKSADDGSSTTSFDFAAEAVNVSGGASQSIGAMVNSFTEKPAGNYTDTITFTAALEDKVTALTMKNASGKTLAAADLGAPSEFTVSSTGKKYYAYNDFIKKTSGSNWNDAMNFVEMLNDNEYGGHTDWILLSSKEMTTAWHNEYGAVYRGNVYFMWSSVECEDNDLNAYSLFSFNSYLDYWEGEQAKSEADSNHGFLVLRGSSNASAATEVTYTRTGKDALSSANLGTPTSWTFNNTTYQVYNGFIPSSSGSSWNDAVGFVDKLNEGTGYQGHKDWTLLSSQAMARAYANNSTGVMPSNRGEVRFLWTSVEDTEYYQGCAYYLRCYNKDCQPGGKSEKGPYIGFVVLRPTEVKYTRTDGTGTLSSADLGTPTEWTYDNKKYEVYNGFIPSSSGSSWNDAKGFVGALNTANYGGHNDWKLLDSNEMATAWNNTFNDSINRGTVNHLWSSDEGAENRAYRLDCRDGDWSATVKHYATSSYGFVVLRGSSN